MEEIKRGIYRDYKGALYMVICVAKHSENLEELVVYKATTGDWNIWAKPKCKFLEEIAVNGKKVPRYKYDGPIPGSR